LLWESGIQGKSWRLIKEIYRNVENNAVFGDFESDWFKQEYGGIRLLRQYSQHPVTVFVQVFAYYHDFRFL
jgi:hypothetical protein